MEIKQLNNEKNGIFSATINGKRAGEMTYTWAGENQFIIDHTAVDPAFTGQGVGLKILEAVVEYARKKEKRVIPLCPFAKAMFEKHKELQDVL